MSLKLSLVCLLLLVVAIELEAGKCKKKKGCKVTKPPRGKQASGNKTLEAPQSDYTPTGSCNLLNFGPFGGKGGRFFSDLDASISGGSITAVTLCGPPNLFRGIYVKYGSHQGPGHGYTGDECTTHTLNVNEVIVGAGGSVGFHIDGSPIISQLRLFTNQQRYFGIGDTTKNQFAYYADGRPLAYINGGAGSAVDFLTFFVRC